MLSSFQKEATFLYISLSH